MAWTGKNYYYHYYYRPISIIIITCLFCGVGICPYCAASNDRIIVDNELQRVWEETVVCYEVLCRPRLESGTLRMQV
jgi:hypothetical protein